MTKEVVEEVVEEVEKTEGTEEISGETEDKVLYEIVDGDVDGVKCRGVRANGNVIFTVTETFTDDQIQEVFNLANRFFNEGVKFGSDQKQAQMKQVMGVIDPIISDEGAELDDSKAA